MHQICQNPTGLTEPARKKYRCSLTRSEIRKAFQTLAFHILVAGSARMVKRFLTEEYSDMALEVYTLAGSRGRGNYPFPA